jgi:cadmium resistance protein CadD (predicted permease)
VSLSGILLKGIFSQHYLSFLGLIPILLGLKAFYHLLRKDKNAGENYSAGAPASFIQVALVTFANGGDNIGVYTPLFAVTSGYYIKLYVLIFIFMVAIWSLAGYYAAKHPLVKKMFSSYGEIILPVFLILLGLGILLQI